jgi:hypothetical protein
MREMKRVFLTVLAAILITTACCYGQTDFIITMTTSKSDVQIEIAGDGKFTINWGDGGIENGTLIFHQDIKFSRIYNVGKISHTISISGDNITGLRCDGNRLTSLDVSKNTALTELACQDNQFSSKSLNALFRTLHSNAGSKDGIGIQNNPGTNDCDRSIATNKGWRVYDR